MTLVALLAVTTQAWAQTDVSTFADLQTALNAGNDVKLTANIQFTSAIEISGSKKILIDGNGKTMSGSSTRAFSISSGNTLAIKNATLNNFDLDAGGGAIRNNGTLVLDGCTVSNNHTDGSNQGGGAIENQGTLYANNTTFSGNYSSEIGGAINNYGGNLYLSGCTFTNNYTTSSNAKFGGAIGNNSSNTVVIVNCTFSGNKYGGSNGSASDLGVYRTPNDYTIAGCTGITIEGATLTTYQYGTATLDYSDLSAISFTYDQSDTPIAVASPVEVDWNKTSKTGTFTMPGGNVTVSVEYYPQAALTAQPTAINDVPATTDGAIVNAGTVANIGSTETAQGTVMYYVSPTALDDAALLALTADKWKADVPTAKSLAQGQAYVYYYVRGNDSDTDEENFSDSDILATNALTVTIAAEPTKVTMAVNDKTMGTAEVAGESKVEWTADTWKGWTADIKEYTVDDITMTSSQSAHIREYTSEDEYNNSLFFFVRKMVDDATVTFSTTGDPFSRIEFTMIGDYSERNPNIIPNDNWTFEGKSAVWEGEATKSLTLQSCSTNVSKITFFKGAIPDGVTINGDGTFTVAKTATVTLKATPAEGYKFLYWEDDQTNTNPVREVTIESGMADMTYKAVFAEILYNVTFVEGTNLNEWTASPAADVKKGQTVTVTYTGTKKVLGVKAEKKAAVLTITVAKGSTDLSGDKLLYYTPGETYRQAIANHPENKLDGGLGWNIWEGGNDATIFYKESADKSRDLSIDGDQHFRPTDSINLDTVIDPTLNFYFVAQF